MEGRKHIAVWLTFAGILLGSYRSDAQSYVELRAEIETFHYQQADLRDGANPNRQNILVACTAGTNEWRIDLQVPGRDSASQWWYDGTNVYMAIHITNSVPSLIGTQPAKHGSNNSTLTATKKAEGVEAGVHIFPSIDGCPLDTQGVNIPWLAFCSGSYLRRPNRIVPLPIVDLRHSPDGFAYSDTTEAFDDELGLPRNIDLSASDALFEYSVMKGPFEGKRDVELWKRGSMGFKWDIPDGALRFRYTVAQSTNFQGWILPLEFSWSLNIPGTGKLIPLGHGKVTSICATESPKSVIEPELHPSVVDWRFSEIAMGIKGIVYLTTNRSALPTNSPELQRTLAERRKTMSSSATRRLWMRRGLAGGVFLILMVPFLAILLEKRKTRKNYEE